MQYIINGELVESIELVKLLIYTDQKLMIKMKIGSGAILIVMLIQKMENLLLSFHKIF